ncbi:MAG: hypothetical protein VX278_20270, partial [Myxococcota bacterium]|nr:hypothetical protein [Myxococcota bacterium]
QLDRADSVEDSILPQIWPESPKQIPNLPLIARMCAYNDQTLMCLLSEESRIVFIDVNKEEITHSVDVPQYQDPSLDQGDGITRDVTAMTVDIDSGRFALGFDDGLYLFFDPKEGGFAQKTLYDVDRQVLTKLHSQPVTDLIFSRGRDEKEYLIAAASDLTMTVIGLAERIPKPKGKGRGPKKNIVQFLAAPTQYFYSISKDNQLYTWQSDVDYPSKTTVEWGPIALGLFPMENNRGELYYQDCLLVGRNDSDLDSAELGVYNITYTHRRTPDANLSIREEKQEGKLSGDLTLFVGAKQFATERLQGSLASRRSLIEWIGTWKDTLSVKLLERAIQEEENPALSTRALELLHATGHPTRALIYKNIIYDEYDEASSRIALDYLRSEELYGKENLFPLTFAFENNGYVQNKALRGFAELAQKRDSDPTNLIYQMAYEQVLSALGESDDDVVDAAFTFLFDGAAPLLPGIEGILLTLSHKEERIQKRGLETMYKKGMLQNPQTREAAKDLLRQVRDSSNENLRYRAFILSLTLEEGVQNYLRYIDPQVHTQLLDLEDEEYRAEYERFANHLELDSTVEAIFQEAISLDQDDRVVDWTEAERIIAAVQPSPDMPMRAYLTFIYCCQTFPMTVEIQERMLSTVQRSVFTPKPLGRDLTFTEEILLQEMSVSYQPEIASLGALALARLGRMQALPILLSLVDTDKALARSRAVDGLLEFIHEPIVEQKLISMVLSARFVKRSKMGQGDKAFDIRSLVEESNFRIRHSEARSIVQLIFRDDVYSQSERMAVRYIFESADITFKSDTRAYLWNEITQKTAAPKEENLRARIMHALFRKAEQRGIESVRSLIRQTQDSGFEDIRMMGVVRLQTHINATIAAEPDWKSKWTRLSEEDWSQDQLGAFVQAEDGSILQKYRGIDPTAPLIGVPKQLLQDMQLLNRIFFWREHEAIVEVVKLYLKHNLIDGNFFRTRRFLLSLSEPKVFSVLLQELLDNVQDTYIQQDPNVHAWHTELWSDFLSQEDRDLALLAYEKLSEKLTGDPDRNQKDGESKKAYQHRIEERPHEEFLLCAYRSTHTKIQQKAISSAFNNQADMQQDWSNIVLELIERFWKIGKQGLKILEEKNRFREGILALLQHERALSQSKKYSPFIKGMTLLLDDSRSKGMIDAEIAEIVAAKVTEWMQKDNQEILSQAESLLLDSRFFSQLPAAQAFGTDHQKRYYDLLKQLYIYQVPKDIADDVAAYKAHMQALTEKMEGIDQAIAQTDIGTLPAEEQEEARVTLQNRKHSLRLLQQEKNNAKEPTPYTDKRFYKVLSLLKDCTAGWVQEELDYFIFSMDEDVSNHAFDIYFVMGMGSHDP